MTTALKLMEAPERKTHDTTDNKETKKYFV